MPRITVAVSASRQNIGTLLGATAFPTGWISGGVVHADPDNTTTLKIGNSAMTADNYDLELEPDESADLLAGRAVMINSLYVLNEAGTEQHLIILGQNT